MNETYHFGNEEIILNTINNVDEWLALYGSVTPYSIFVVFRQIYLIQKYYPGKMLCSTPGIFYDDYGSQGIYYVDKEEYRQSFKYFLENREELKTISDDFFKADKTFNEFFEDKIQTTTNFIELYDDFMNVYDGEYVPGAVFDGTLVYSDELTEELSKKYPNIIDEIRTLVIPSKLTFTARAEKDILKIAIKCKENNKTEKDVKEELKQYHHNYHWVRNNYKDSGKIPIEDFEKELKELLEKTKEELKKQFEEHNNFDEEHKKEIELINQKNIFEKEDFEQLKAIGETAFVLDKRKENNLKGNYFIFEYLKQISEEKEINFEHLKYLLDFELNEIMNGNKTIDDYPVKDRLKSGLFFIDMEGNVIFYTGNAAKEFNKKVESTLEHSDEIIGRCAMQGTAKGNVKIIFDANKAQDFNEGDILVTGMTRPEFVPLMKKAGAIITDEGGITCHAAIMSRELKKPCIIGTGNATKLLKSGELIEVNADEGTVKKI